MNEITGGLMLLIVMSFAPTLIAVFASCRPFQAFVVFILNLAAIACAFLLLIPGIVIWLFDLIIAIMVYNGANRDKASRRLLKALHGSSQAAQAGKGQSHFMNRRILPSSTS